MTFDLIPTPVPRSFPRVIPEHLESLITLFSIIQPLFQWVVIIPICSAVGASHRVAASNIETAYGNVIDARFRWVKDGWPGADFNQFFVRIEFLKVGSNGRVSIVSFAILGVG